MAKQLFSEVKMIGGKFDGVTFLSKDNPDLCRNFRNDVGRLYQLGDDTYRPGKIENGCLILKAERGFLH